MANLTERTIAWRHWHRHLNNWLVHWADIRFGALALILLAIAEPICVPIPAYVIRKPGHLFGA